MAKPAVVLKTAIPSIAETVAEYRVPTKDVERDLQWLLAVAEGSADAEVLAKLLARWHGRTGKTVTVTRDGRTGAFVALDRSRVTSRRLGRGQAASASSAKRATGRRLAAGRRSSAGRSRRRASAKK